MGEGDSGSRSSSSQGQGQGPVVSFKINRKSEAASVLKSSIASKLPDFLSDYSDEVLAEYITVLVCNGKHQYQARDDLEAFLGKRSADFVSWLWGLLFNRARQSDSQITITALSDPIHVASVTTKDHHAFPSSFSLIVNCESNLLPLPDRQLLQPKRGIKTPSTSTHLKSSSPIPRPSENPHPRHISAPNVTGTNLSAQPAAVVSHRIDRPRGSVWDRLGKPCDDISQGSRTVDVSGVVFVKQQEQILNAKLSVVPVSNGEQSRTITGEVTRLDNNLSETRKLPDVVGSKCDPHSVSNVKRKRHFGEISTGLGADSIPVVDERNVDLQCKENTQDFKNSNLTKDSKTTTPNMASEVLDVKQRLHQIEIEMSKLRSRRLAMEKDGKPNLLLNSRSSRLAEEDSERTVLVTNVHFAATKEGLSLYFAKCGEIANLVILIDEATAQPKGSAYVTFSSKESVDKALELSGTTFLSRTIKVLRKVETAASTSGPALLAGRQCQTPLTHINRNFIPNKLYCSSSPLQWRRVSISTLSEPSASTNDKLKGAASSTFQQQLPSSTASLRTSEVNSLSRVHPAAS
ncbi:uncharacterized protein LOC112004610 isoform X2 [Quercus suber]|uniref:uncharacterized protein LOC112004610 isoform X2 n=1 Tax=Quercus suber TaxID=58331 RepID=UPI000CE239AD|nr:uncharacterized protein LOC112004610 isoform X3 [Quercus suber]POE60588.1 polyadenylate-binding protein 2 [Quercus suber]